VFLRSWNMASERELSNEAAKAERRWRSKSELGEEATNRPLSEEAIACLPRGT
jgi:hypothetical protein